MLLNAMADDVERESMRFMAFCADRLVLHLNPSMGDMILDAACGVGALTLAASQAVGSSGRVVAIDRAPRTCWRVSMPRFTDSASRLVLLFCKAVAGAAAA